ncbi:hypothetical protein L6R46_02340 [Myxococcota bacterium]|nr:hypothetical protein [Myxococcota bacterium]
MQTRLADRLSNLLFLPVRLVGKAIPKPLRDHLEDRLFYAIFQVTRVTNDAYPRREAEAEAAGATEPVNPPSSGSGRAADRPRSSPRR